MPDNTVHTIVTGPAVPLTLVVQRDEGRWVLRAFYHGNTIAEAMRPQLVAERYFSPDEIPSSSTWSTLWTEVALAVEDLATLSNGIVRID
jgi:hypothetical protein